LTLYVPRPPTFPLCTYFLDPRIGPSINSTVNRLNLFPTLAAERPLHTDVNPTTPDT
jgi:hypothetical protein